MKSGLNEPLGFSAIDFEAAKASSFDLPTTKVSKRYRGLNVAWGRSTAGVGGRSVVGMLAPSFARTVRLWRTRPYTPRTNGKAERFIQTLLREWAYRFSYESSEERKRWLTPYLHFYNYHRAHSALEYNPPISRLARNNVLKRNS